MNRVEKALAHATETKALRIGAGILPQSGDMFRELFPGKRAVIIADPTTLRVAGSDVRDSPLRPQAWNRTSRIFSSRRTYTPSGNSSKNSMPYCNEPMPFL